MTKIIDGQGHTDPEVLKQIEEDNTLIPEVGMKRVIERPMKATTKDGRVVEFTGRITRTRNENGGVDCNIEVPPIDLTGAVNNPFKPN